MHQPLVASLCCWSFTRSVSVAAYRFLTKTTRKSLPVDSTPVDITTPVQQARGETSYQIVTGREEVTVEIPWSVKLYVIFGYIGLAVALVVAVVIHFRE